MKTVTFYYVRHGKTEFNRDGIIQGGRVDSPLATEGIPTIEQSAQALAPIRLDACYCSPLSRAGQTAQVLLAARTARPPLHTLDSLREVDFGSIDGKPYEGNRATFARCFMRQDFSPVGGESGREVRTRVRRAFEEMYGQSESGSNVLVVGHGAYLRYVVLEFLPKPRAARALTSRVMRASNASITTIEATDGTFTLTRMPTKAQDFQPRQ